jgi:MFS family permease
VFLFGLAVFTAGSPGSALSGDLWVLIILRCIQAVGAAALVPTSLGLILTGMPPEHVKRSIQIWSISASVGAAAGPALGGLLVGASWRWIFIINVPIGVAALAVAAVIAPNARHHHETGIPDMLGGALLILGVGALSLALIQGPGWGWSGGRTIGCFAGAAVALALFVVRSRQARSPVVDLALFRNRDFRWANIANFSLSIGFGIQLLGLVLWLQEGWGWSALITGLAIAPGPVMVSVTALGLRRYTAKLPHGLVAAAGAVIMAAGGILIGVSLSAADHNYAGEVLPGWMIIGAGAGLAVPTVITAASARLAAHQTSTGSAVVQMDRQIGGVLGVAVLVVVVGSAQLSAAALHDFKASWYWSAGFIFLAALTALRLIEPATKPGAVASSEAARAPAA